jgi:4-amino-4-deoxy-L-arabinose transferase-like glycosyltransferase
VGGLSRYDEFLAHDRALGFVRTGDWFTTYTNNVPSFEKPPLQYWMTAGLMVAGVTDTVALRLPSMLFALGMLCVAAWLAHLLVPNTPSAMPLAVLLLTFSTWFWSYANSAMLETGAAFFATGALACAIVALRRPRFWYLVAAMIGAGALQKAPVGLLFLMSALPALWIAHRGMGAAWASIPKSPALWRAAVVACGLVLAWPLLQSAMHGIGAARRSHGREMIMRFAPDPEEGLRGLADIERLLVTGEPWLRWPALVAVLILPLVVRRPAAVMVTAVVVIYATALTVAGGSVYQRYTVTILPLLMAALAAVLMHLRPVPWTGLALGGVIVGLSGGPIQTDATRQAALQPAGAAMQIAVLRGVGAEIASGETLVYCWSEGLRRLWPGAVSVHASNGRPVLRATELARDPGLAEGPFRGVCPATEIGQVEPIMRGFAVVREEAGYVVWTAEGLR